MFWNNLKMALISITNAKMRSFLTMLGIIIGISSVVSINALGEGLKQDVAGQINGLGTNVITVTSGQSIQTSGDGKNTRVNPAAGIGTSTLTESDLDRLARVEHVSQVAPLDLISGLATRGDKRSDGSFILATTPNYQTIRELKLGGGRFFEESDSQEFSVVLGSEAKQNLFGGEAAIGQEISIRGRGFKVIGVLAATETGASSLTGGGFDSAIYLPVGSAKQLTGGQLQIFRILTKVDDSRNIKETVRLMKEVLKDNHGGQEDFSVLTQEDLVNATGGILDILTLAISLIASIGLLVAGVGIMNIMLVSVTERTREIGLRKALGARSTTVLMQFLIEAVTLSLLGGLLGVAAGVGQGAIVQRVAKVTVAYTPQAILQAAGIAVVIGLIFGMAPAIKAARKRPIDALRYE